MLKSYKITLQPEMKTIIESVTYLTKFGLICNAMFGSNFKFFISFVSVYYFIIYNILNFIGLTSDIKFFLLSNPDIFIFLFFIFFVFLNKL